MLRMDSGLMQTHHPCDTSCLICKQGFCSYKTLATCGLVLGGSPLMYRSLQALWILSTNYFAGTECISQTGPVVRQHLRQWCVGWQLSPQLLAVLLRGQQPMRHGSPVVPGLGSEEARGPAHAHNATPTSVPIMHCAVPYLRMQSSITSQTSCLSPRIKGLHPRVMEAAGRGAAGITDCV